MEFAETDVFKVLTLLYILVVSFISPKYLAFANNLFVKILLIAITVVIVLIYDIVLGVVMGVALIITFVRADSMYDAFPVLNTRQQFLPPVQFIEKVKTKSKQETETTMVIDPPETSYQVETQIETKQEEAQKALEKYAVDSLLHKASTDGIIDEHYNTFPKNLGVQFNIQGIETDIVGYNYLD